MGAQSTPQELDHLGRPNGTGSCARSRWAAVKGLIWYNPKNFQSKGYSVPTSWDQLTNLQSQIKASGTTPWCVTVESGSASGWPASDWLKEIVLSQAGPDVYDKWVAGTQKWTSPEIKQAWQTFGQVLGPNDSNTYGGKQFMALGQPRSATSAPHVPGTHRSATLNQASFITTFFTSANPSLQPGTDFNFFRFLTSTRSTRAPTSSRVTRSRCSRTPRRPQADQYLTTARRRTSGSSGGKPAVNKDVPLTDYPDVLSRSRRTSSSRLRSPSTTPPTTCPPTCAPRHGRGLLDFIGDQGKLDSILTSLDKVQATAYHS